jgi:hypothetical protein
LSILQGEEQSIEKDLEKYFDILCFDEFTGKKSRFAFALSSSNHFYLLWVDQRNRFLFSINEASEIFFNIIEWEESQE